MTADILQRYWALLTASVIGTAVLLFVLFRLYGSSAQGQLAARVRELRTRQQAARKAVRAVKRNGRKLKRLRARAASVKPRLIDEAAGRLADAEALRKIADDQVLIAQNLVRKVIVEEYPPKRHAALRDKYMPRLQDDDKPFSF